MNASTVLSKKKYRRSLFNIYKISTLSISSGSLFIKINPYLIKKKVEKQSRNTRWYINIHDFSKQGYYEWIIYIPKRDIKVIPSFTQKVHTVFWWEFFELEWV